MVKTLARFLASPHVLSLVNVLKFSTSQSWNCDLHLRPHVSGQQKNLETIQLQHCSFADDAESTTNPRPPTTKLKLLYIISHAPKLIFPRKLQMFRDLMLRVPEGAFQQRSPHRTLPKQCQPPFQRPETPSWVVSER